MLVGTSDRARAQRRRSLPKESACHDVLDGYRSSKTTAAMSTSAARAEVANPPRLVLRSSARRRSRPCRPRCRLPAPHRRGKLTMGYLSGRWRLHPGRSAAWIAVSSTIRYTDRLIALVTPFWLVVSCTSHAGSLPRSRSPRFA